MTTLELPSDLHPGKTISTSARATGSLSPETFTRERAELQAAASEIIGNALSADSEAFVAASGQPVGQ
jgi:hypothetical protein